MQSEKCLKKIKIKKSLMKYCQLLFLIIFMSASDMYAQQKIINGTVRDITTQQKLEDVSIIYQHGTKHSHSTANGNFIIQTDVFPDTLWISRVGYETKPYLLTEGKNAIQINLSRREVQLNQVQVNTFDFRKNITKVDLNKIPVNSAQDLLRKVPGLFIAQHAGGGKAEQIFLRGFDNDHGTDIAIAADGIPVNMVSHAHGQGYADLHFIIPETVKDIDYGKGAYYADKGDLNTSGYVNFTTLDRLDKNLFKVEGGSFNSWRTLAMLNLVDDSEKNRHAYIASEFNYTDGPFDIKQNFNRVNVFAKYNQWLDQKQYINLQGSAFSSGWNASGQIPERAVESGLISRWGSIDPTEGGATSRINLSLNYKNFISESESWESLFYFTKYKFQLFSNFTFFLNDPVYGDEIEQLDNRNLYGFENKYIHNYQLDNSRLVWTSGFGLRVDDIKNLQLNHVYQRDSWLKTLSHVSAVEMNMHGFTNVDWHLGKWLINPALRVDHFIFNLHDYLQNNPAGKDASATRVSPKLNFAYISNKTVQYYLKTGMGFHSNDIRVVVAQNGKDILPASFGSDLGLIWKPLENLVIQPALWGMYLQQEFVYVGDEAVVEPSGKTKRLGADLGIRYQVTPWLYFDGDINYAYARFIDEPKGQDYIPLVPSLTSTGGMAFKLPYGLSANLRYRYMNTKPATEDNEVKAKSYFVNDLMLNYTKRKWNVMLQMQNLFDTKWNEAQFETETRLRNEHDPISELHFTPGTPFLIKAGVGYRF